MRKRVLIVNAFFDEYRRTTGSPYRVPRAMGPIYLAGAFSRGRCEVRIHNEQFRGALDDLSLLAWPDMLVLTGVTSAFDRMRQLTAYARALNPKIVVVAGGPAIRALPGLSRRYFDYACTGDIEQLAEVVAEVFGPSFAANEMFPRYDLMDRSRLLGYVESSRNCNFRCSFCSLTGEGGAYRKYDVDFVRRQILATGKRQIVFIDNNFFGNDRQYFLDRVAMLKDLRRLGRIDGWSALVTGDFFKRHENLALVREAGCQSLFSGVESFDADTLAAYNKRQNRVVPQVEMIKTCLEAGILFIYGIMLDPTTRGIADLRREIEFILASREITLPAFFTLAIPLIGTPYFKDCLNRNLLLPNVRVRDLDGVTLTMHPRDPLEEAAAFARDLPSLRGYRRALVAHALSFALRYRRRLSPLQLFAATVNAALIGSETTATSPTRRTARAGGQTFVATTEVPDPQYTPRLRLPEQLRDHFVPTMLTDASGALADDVADDLLAA